MTQGKLTKSQREGVSVSHIMYLYPISGVCHLLIYVRVRSGGTRTRGRLPRKEAGDEQKRRKDIR